MCHSVSNFAETSKPLPDFADVDVHERALPDGVLQEHLRAFRTLYREHCEARARAKHGRQVILVDVDVGRELMNLFV